MFKKIVFLILTLSLSLIASDKLNGAGASFPAPAYNSLAYSYQKDTKNRVNYQSIGSGGGIKQVSSRVVDFGASDEPLKQKDIDEAKLYQFPALIGSIVITYNVKGIKDKELKLNNELLADIFLGKIKKWNDAQIVQINPNLKLPNENIILIRRSDGSGTTFNFTSFLAQVSKEWKDNYGEGKAIDWPTGIAAKGNEGVASLTKQTPNSISYIENAYAISNNLSRSILTTKNGKWVEPDNENFKAAAKYAKWNKESNFYELLILQDGDNSYPIVAATVILLPDNKQNNNKKVTKFFDYIYTNGDETLLKLGYIPLPNETKDLIRSYWNEKNIAPSK